MHYKSKVTRAYSFPNRKPRDGADNCDSLEVLCSLSPLILSSSIFSFKNMAVGTHSKDILQSTALMLDIAQHICDTYGRRLRFPSASTWFTSLVPNPIYEGFSFFSCQQSL